MVAVESQNVRRRVRNTASLVSTRTPRRSGCLQFTDKETEAQRGDVC